MPSTKMKVQSEYKWRLIIVPKLGPFRTLYIPFICLKLIVPSSVIWGHILVFSDSDSICSDFV